jgi:hypothetical protein
VKKDRCGRTGAQVSATPSHDVPDWGREKREVVSGCLCARRTRTMKQCSSDARTMGHPTHSPFEFTATGKERERKSTLV